MKQTSTREYLVTQFQFPGGYIFLKINCLSNGIKNKYTEDVTERRRDILKIIFSSSKIKAQTKKKSKQNYIKGISYLRASLISSLNRRFVTVETSANLRLD